ncbi:hypothetical protein FB45DRAFT_1086741 [Roridomyces roridus]|uniref:NAD(P)-binding protein n=1 Tax=Roridomyces roridus TaxID=1738132 RepID=A0AAD7BLQ7_9AGAR|nr:hypothetical protein FB45DRAFT_1086741 [Roridomyces roridus]
MSSPRTILVTGANQGLGMHTVHQLASTPDVLVFMGSRKLASAEEAIAKFASDVHPSSTVVPVQLDITDATSIQNAHDVVAKMLQEKGLSGLDALVNNAAIAAGTPEAIYTTNVVGTARVKDTFLPLIKKGGAILNVSSALGSNARFAQRPPEPVMLTIWPHYSSSKAALNSLTVQWALDEEQNGSGIRVISICPGLDATNLNDYIEAGGSPADGCKVIVKEALVKDGKTSIFVHKDGEYPW